MKVLLRSFLERLPGNGTKTAPNVWLAEPLNGAARREELWETE